MVLNTEKRDKMNRFFFITIMILVIDRRKSEGLLIKQVVGNEGETIRFEESLVYHWWRDIQTYIFQPFPRNNLRECPHNECRYSAKFNTTGDEIGTFTIRDVQLRDSAEYTVLDYYTWHSKVLIYFRVLSVNDTNCTFTTQSAITVGTSNRNRVLFTGNCNIVLRSNVKSDNDNGNLLRGSFTCNDRNGNIVNVRGDTIVKFNENTRLSLSNIIVVVNRNNDENNGGVSRRCYLTFEIVDGSTNGVIYASDRRYYDIEVR